MALIAIHGQTLTILYSLQQARNIDHGRDAKFAGHDCSMGEVVASFHHNGAGSQEKATPGAMGGACMGPVTIVQITMAQATASSENP